MDIDLLKSAPEDQMEIMMMMMMMDKVPDYNDVVQIQTTDNTTTKDVSFPQMFNNPHAAPSTFMSLQSTTISFSGSTSVHQEHNSMAAAMREMIFQIAAMQPIHIDPESVKPPKRRNVKISKDPQSVAARHRREKISERIRILQRLVPGGTKMDTASMLDEAIQYVKFLKKQVQSLERLTSNGPIGIGFPVPMAGGNYQSPQNAENIN